MSEGPKDLLQQVQQVQQVIAALEMQTNKTEATLKSILDVTEQTLSNQLRIENALASLTKRIQLLEEEAQSEPNQREVTAQREST